MQTDFKKLIDTYAKICEKYAAIFCKKHGLKKYGWANDRVGTCLICSDFYFDFNDVRYDIDCNIPNNFILSYYDYCGENEYPISYTKFIEMTWE